MIETACLCSRAAVIPQGPAGRIGATGCSAGPLPSLAQLDHLSLKVRQLLRWESGSVFQLVECLLVFNRE